MHRNRPPRRRGIQHVVMFRLHADWSVLPPALLPKARTQRLMDPGNTVYVGLGFSHQPASQPWRWVKSGTSILAFILGSFVFSRLMRSLGTLRRSTMTLTTLLQALLTFGAALLSTLDVRTRRRG